MYDAVGSSLVLLMSGDQVKREEDVQWMDGSNKYNTLTQLCIHVKPKVMSTYFKFKFKINRFSSDSLLKVL